MIFQVCLVILGFTCVNSQGVRAGVNQACLELPQPGKCLSFFPSFYYNTATGSCDCFVYTGCDGNSNRFGTLEGCMNTCNVPQSQQIISTTCQEIFAGTQVLKSLANEFSNLQNQFLPSLVPAPPPAPGAPKPLPSSSTLKEVIPGIPNSCLLRPQPGNCKAFFPSFYFRPESRSCDCFVYTGCQGNENRFSTLADCMSTCNASRRQQLISDTCREILNGTSTLRDLLNEFNPLGNPPTTIQTIPPPPPPTQFPSVVPLPLPTTRQPARSPQLPSFSFSSQESSSDVSDSCLEPLRMGDCKAFFPSFYYRPETQSCDCFVYSGCDGNRNRFESLSDCMQKCDVSQSVQTISQTCRDIFRGTDALESMVDDFGFSNPQIDLRDKTPTGKETFRPTSRPVLPTSTSPPKQTTRRTTPKPRQSSTLSSLAANFFRPAQHPWQKNN